TSSADLALKLWTVLQPVGPLSPQVYWRRRLAVLGGIGAVVLIGLATCSGGNPGAAGRRGSAAPTGTATPTTTLPTGPPTGPSSRPATLPPSPGSAGGPAPGSPTTSGTASPGGTAPGGDPDPGGSSGTAVGGTSPEPCPDAALTVQASTAKPSYRVGETPVVK